SVSDNEGAEAWLDDYFADALEDETIVKSEEADGTLYVSELSFDTSVLLADGVMFIGMSPALETIVMPGDDLVNLAQTAEFQDAISALPLDDYNALVYLNGELLATGFSSLYETMLMQTPEGRQALGMMGMADV